METGSHVTTCTTTHSFNISKYSETQKECGVADTSLGRETSGAAPRTRAEADVPEFGSALATKAPLE